MFFLFSNKTTFNRVCQFRVFQINLKWILKKFISFRTTLMWKIRRALVAKLTSRIHSRESEFCGRKSRK